MKKFQKQGTHLIKTIDGKYGTTRDPHFSFTQLMEEIGELARAINAPKLRKKKLDLDNLGEEFADVLLQLAILADMHGIDLEEALNDKMEVLKEKHGV